MSKLPALIEPDLYYARWANDTHWRGFYRHGASWSLYGCRDDEAVIVRCRERRETDPESSYWGWEYAPAQDPSKGRGELWHMIQPARILLEMCFPYGTAVLTERGHGRVVNLIVERA